MVYASLELTTPTFGTNNNMNLIKNEKEVSKAYNYTLGVFYCIGHAAVTSMLIVLLIVVIGNTFSIGTDSTDVSGWNRSGLRIHLDAKTGIEYLSDGKGGLIVRQQKSPE